MGDDEFRIIQCSNCATKNQVPENRFKDNPRCGKCGASLEMETPKIELEAKPTIKELFDGFLKWPLWVKISIVGSLLWCLAWYVVSSSDHPFNKTLFGGSFVPVVLYWGIAWVFQNTTKKFKKIAIRAMIACAVLTVIISFYLANI